MIDLPCLFDIVYMNINLGTSLRVVLYGGTSKSASYRSARKTIHRHATSTRIEIRVQDAIFGINFGIDLCCWSNLRIQSSLVHFFVIVDTSTCTTVFLKRLLGRAIPLPVESIARRILHPILAQTVKSALTIVPRPASPFVLS